MRNPSRPTLTNLTLGLGLCCAAVAASAQTLVLDLVDANASPITVNEQGHILGYQQSWPCGNPTLCAPQTLPAVWRDGQALRLPTQVGLYAAPAALSPTGMAVGSLTDYGSTAKAVVWQFNGTSYGIQELGQLGLAQSAATAVDQQERVIGYAPKYSNKDALIRNYKWYLEHLHQFEGQSGVSHRVPWKQGILGFAKLVF